MLNWRSSIRWRLCKLLLIVKSQEVQLIATAICILGGSNHALLLEVSDSSPQAAKDNIRRLRCFNRAAPRDQQTDCWIAPSLLRGGAGAVVPSDLATEVQPHHEQQRPGFIVGAGPEDESEAASV